MGRSTDNRVWSSPRGLRVLLGPALLMLAACAGVGNPFVAKDKDGVEIGQPVEVRLIGADSIPAHRLLRAIEDRMYDLSRSPQSEAIAEDVRFDIEDFYREQGFPDVAVTTQLKSAETGEGRILDVVVQEGPTVTVRSMDIRGAAAFSRERLLEFWLQRGSGAFGLGPPLYVRSDVLGFVQSVRIFLRGEGYLDATVTIESTTFDEPGEQVEIDIRVEEGHRFEVGTAVIEPLLEAALGDARIESPVGETATARRLDDFRTAVLDALRRRGRPEPRIRAELARRITADGHFVDVRILGDPGRLARVVEVEIDGLEDTDEDVVRSRLEIEVGEVYDGSRLDESLRSLYLTGLFQRVDVDRIWVDGPVGSDGAEQMKIRLSIVEQDTRSLEALIGWGSYERARGKLRFEEANLLGTGRGLVIEGRLSQKGWRGLATISDPNFLDTGLRFSISADALEREEPSFVDRAYGGTIALTRTITDRWTARAGYSYRLHTGLSSDVVDPAAAITDYIAGSPFLETRYDSRDSLIYPRDGWQLNGQVDANKPEFGADIDFVRMRVGASYYVPFSKVLGLALRTDHGWLWPGEGSELVPLQERFYNGGENTVRSFLESQLGPLDVNGNPVGGEYRNVMGAELRGRLVKTLEGALFADAGNAGSSVSDYGFSDLRYALGLGLRLALPIGPVRVDAGWNPDRRPGEKEWVVHLSVGYPF